MFVLKRYDAEEEVMNGDNMLIVFSAIYALNLKLFVLSEPIFQLVDFAVNIRLPLSSSNGLCVLLSTVLAFCF